MRPFRTLFAASAVAATALALTSGGALARSDNRGYDPSYYDSDSAPLADWEVFGFDLSSVPDDVDSLMAFKASLDPRTQLAINNRCKFQMSMIPTRYSAKIRRFCWGR